MRKSFKITALVTIILVSFAQIANCQTNKNKAFEMAREAISLMDNGKIDESIKLLEKAQKLDPDNILFPYEIAYANYLKKDYQNVIKILEKLTKRKDVTDLVFQLLGNSYSVSGKKQKALDTYDLGLKKFPNSGKLYLEKGNIYLMQEDYNKAISFYEKGIEVEPTFPSNYYRATLLYCNSTEEVWGMIYGEIFMNLERGSRRTEEISKLLFDTYKSEIQFKDENNINVSFSKNLVITDINKLPFGMIYEPTLLLAVVGEKNIDINSLDKIRTNFLNLYYEQKHNKTHPNVLFDYQKQIEKAGHLEAYNYWLLMKGDEDGFDVWHSENKEKWDKFVKWFSENPLKLSSKNKFYRNQY